MESDGEKEELHLGFGIKVLEAMLEAPKDTLGIPVLRILHPPLPLTRADFIDLRLRGLSWQNFNTALVGKNLLIICFLNRLF